MQRYFHPNNDKQYYQWLTCQPPYLCLHHPIEHPKLQSLLLYGLKHLARITSNESPFLAMSMVSIGYSFFHFNCYHKIYFVHYRTLVSVGLKQTICILYQKLPRESPVSRTDEIQTKHKCEVNNIYIYMPSIFLVIEV